MFKLRLFLCVLLLTVSMSAHSSVVDIRIDLTKQQMDVIVAGYHEFTWDISSARDGYETPIGKFRPSWMTRMHYSEQYQYSPMPHSIFFHQGYAIHATNELHLLGSPASHGCVRISPDNARVLYDLVELYGMRETSIVLVNQRASAARYPATPKGNMMWEDTETSW